MKRIGLFCGCFNPIHKGHLRAAEEFLRAGELERVFLVPASGRYGKLRGLAPDGVHRLRMCALAAGGRDDIAVCDFEIRSPGLPDTMDTVEYFRDRFPGAVLFLCMGGDTAGMVPRWACFPELRESVSFLVIRRSGGSGAPEELTGRGTRVTYLDREEDGISSTAIRGKLLRGESSIPELDEKVLGYIREHALYGK